MSAPSSGGGARPLEGGAVERVCIVLLSGLGDVVHGLPLVNALKFQNPSRHITWIVEPMPAPLLAGHPSVDRVVVYQRRRGLRGLRDLARDLRTGERPDVTINLNVFLKSVAPALLSRGKCRLGFDRGRSFEGVWLFANETLPPGPRAHTADMFLEFAEYLGVPVTSPEWRIALTAGEREEQRRFFAPFDSRPVATIVPSTATHKKDWLSARWASIADALSSDFGFHVVIAGGPGDREQRIAREIMHAASVKPEWALGDSIRRLTWILEGSSLVLAPDTGPVHISRALGVPVIGLYAHTNPWRVGPWRAFQDLWIDRYTDEGTPPDPTDRTPKWNRMPTISVDDVLQRIQTAVERYGVLGRA